MSIDIRTLAIVLGITNILQAIAIFFQYLLNKIYRGMGWWAWGFASVTGGSVLLSLRDVISIALISIILSNALLVLGAIFIYIGIMRFLDKKENRWIVLSIFAVFIASFFYFTYVNDDLTIRTVIGSAVIAILSFLTAQGLFANKTRSIAASAYFLLAICLAHGCFFTFRAVAELTVAPTGSFFNPTLIQTATILVTLVEGMLLTYGLIVMVNQRSGAEMREAKEHFELTSTPALMRLLLPAQTMA